jgi:tetratricopeptide (TPR) repeat protein
MISIALFIALVLSLVISFVLFIVVLVKMFKNAGALTGILGFLSIGIYALIWGWIKHKEFALTKIMVSLSTLIVISVASVVLVPEIWASGKMEFMSYAEKFSGDLGINLFKQEAKKAPPKASLPAKQKIKKVAAKSTKKKTLNREMEQDVDWSQKAMALWEDGKFKNPKKAVDYLSRAISDKQNTIEAYNNRGLAYHELKQYDNAIEDYSQAIKLDPAQVTAYNNRGNSYYERNEYQLALADFNQSLERKPDYAKAHLNRGLVYYQMDQTDQACKDFQNASDHGDPDGINWALKNAICK